MLIKLCVQNCGKCLNRAALPPGYVSLCLIIPCVSGGSFNQKTVKMFAMILSKAITRKGLIILKTF